MPAPTDDGAGQRTAGWIVGGVGLAAAGVGGILALGGSSKQGTAIDAATAAYASGADTGAARSDYDAAGKQMTMGYVLAGVGGAAVVTGIVLIATARSAEPRSALRVGPWLGASSGGATLRGSF